ncbi:hypothetical protein B0H66DRAFT_443380, partial [Apodospora peruviana]
RNRVAATRCRAKTKVSVAKLEERDRAMSATRAELMGQVETLKQEVYTLKQELFKHVDCDCTDIRAYLKYTARRI